MQRVDQSSSWNVTTIVSKGPAAARWRPVRNAPQSRSRSMKRSLANKFQLGEKWLVARLSTQTSRSTFGVMNGGYETSLLCSPINGGCNRHREHSVSTPQSHSSLAAINPANFFKPCAASVSAHSCVDLGGFLRLSRIRIKAVTALSGESASRQHKKISGFSATTPALANSVRS